MQLLPILTAVAEQSIPGRPATWQESLRLMGAGWGSIFIVILAVSYTHLTLPTNREV